MDSAIQTAPTSKVRRVDFGGAGPRSEPATEDLRSPRDTAPLRVDQRTSDHELDLVGVGNPPYRALYTPSLDLWSDLCFDLCRRLSTPSYPGITLRNEWLCAAPYGRGLERLFWPPASENHGSLWSAERILIDLHGRRRTWFPRRSAFATLS